MRYVMWIAGLSESSNLWTHIALMSGSAVCEYIHLRGCFLFLNHSFQKRKEKKNLFLAFSLFLVLMILERKSLFLFLALSLFPFSLSLFGLLKLELEKGKREEEEIEMGKWTTLFSSFFFLLLLFLTCWGKGKALKERGLQRRLKWEIGFTHSFFLLGKGFTPENLFVGKLFAFYGSK